MLRVEDILAIEFNPEIAKFKLQVVTQVLQHFNTYLLIYCYLFFFYYINHFYLLKFTSQCNFDISWDKWNKLQSFYNEIISDNADNSI